MNDEQAKAIYTQIGDRVRQAREAANFTQNELAERIVLTRASIANIEKARQSVQIHTLYDIAQALDVSVFSLLPSQETATPVSVEARLRRAMSKAPQLGHEEKQFLRQVLAPSLELIPIDTSDISTEEINS